MNRFLALISAALFLAAGTAAYAQEDQYVLVYNLIQDADASANADVPLAALNKYLRAQTELQKFQKVYPEWNSRIVNFRLNYLAAKIADFSGRTAAPAIATPIKSAPTAPPPVQPAIASDIQAQIGRAHV